MSTTITSTSPTEASHTSGPIALAGAPRPAGSAAKSKPRKRVNTAEKRHQHNAIERQRRETLNSKFLVLARLLPSLAACRRPSKSAIVNGSITHLTHQRNQRLLAAKLLRQMTAERDELFAEVNEWRKANGFPPKAGPAASWTSEMEEICQVEKETFGSFANVDESNEDQNDEEEEQSAARPSSAGSGSMNVETAAVVAGNINTGLFTPRNSTDMNTAAAPLTVNTNMNNMNWNNGYQVSPAVPFSAFMSDSATSVDSSESPLGSSHPNAMPTPPSMEQAMYVHQTPSPRSTASADDAQPPVQRPAGASRTASMPAQWGQQHLAAFQQSIQQQQQAQAPQQPPQHFAVGAALPGQQPHFAQYPGQPPMQPAPANAHGFNQLMASMFSSHPGDAVQSMKPPVDQHAMFNFNLAGWGAEQSVGV